MYDAPRLDSTNDPVPDILEIMSRVRKRDVGIDVPDNWLEYLRRNPIGRVNLVDFPASTSEVKVKKSGSRETQLHHNHELGVAIVSSPAKEQDAWAIGIENGTVNLVWADGISNSLVPEWVAREAVKQAMLSLQNSQTDDLFERIQHSISGKNTLDTALRKIDHYKSDTSFLGQAIVDNLQDVLRKGEIAGVMLGYAQYEPNARELKYAFKGDLRVIIIRKNNIDFPVTLQATEAEALSYGKSGPGKIISGRVSLEPGDVVILETDGTDKVPDILKMIQSAMKVSNHASQLELQLAQLLRDQITTIAGATDLGSPDDDITSMFICAK